MNENKETTFVMEIIGTMDLFDHVMPFYNSIDNPWFLSIDIAHMLDYKNHQIELMLELVDKGDKSSPCQNEAQYASIFVNENGLYDICLRSSKPKARAISKEVKRLLQILRKGGHLKTFKTFQNMMEELENRIAIEEFGEERFEDE